MSDYGSDVDNDEMLAVEAVVKFKRKRADEKGNDITCKKPKIVDVSNQIACSILQSTWKFPAFRLGQEAAISRLIRGESAVVIFPTGGGKSLVYQVPALAFDEYDYRSGRSPGGGVTLVISPLIALMKDQVDVLRKIGVAAAAMDSTQSRDQWLDTCQKLKNNTLKLLYVAPERLQNEGFISMISATKIRMVAVDEAHCVSQWGHAFRPDYLKVARFIKEVQAERVLCLTATATKQVANDICQAFGIPDEGVFSTPSYRPNLSLRAESYSTEAQKLAALKKFLVKHTGSGIVYVQTHDQTDQVSSKLKKAGFNAYGYHAGMTTEARTQVQDIFMKAKEVIVVATIAFGMGIDKADIRNVVHFAVPKSLEGYSQEIGRAGRDGLPSTCMIYLCAQDIAIMEEWSRGDVPSLRSVEGVINTMFEKNKTAMAGSVIERNLWDESRLWDLRANALGILNAYLELECELIRAITPKYSKYTYKDSGGKTAMARDASDAGKAIRMASKPAKVLTHIDVDDAARMGHVRRDAVVRTLQEYHNKGWILLTASGVVNRFTVLKAFPTNLAERNKIIIDCHAKFETREREDMERIQAVISFVTMDGCLSRELARHFGDESAIPEGGCSNCEHCITHKRVNFKKGSVQKAKIDQKLIKAVLKATTIRDDARFLARVAFGISSPRVTQEKLGKHEVFGSMKDCDFEELVKRFKLDCLS